MTSRREKPRIYEPRPRLIAARERRYASPAEAAEAMGVVELTYRSHENGARGLGRSAERYARFFGVSLDWLVSGKGSMSGAPTVRIIGRVGAGAVVGFDADAEEISAGESVEMPSEWDAQAFVVEGDSMRPRFMPGEVLIFEKHPALEAALVGQYCLVQIKSDEAPRLIKVLRAGRGANRWRLESHNADPIEDVELIGAWRWVALLPPRAGPLVVPETRRRRR